MFKILKKMFDNEYKELYRFSKLADQIDALDEEMSKLSDKKLASYTDKFKKRLEEEETLDDILVEAFAVAREAAYRCLGMKPFYCQLLGGLAIHYGNIAEMKTGEGKTLTCVLPAYLNALTGKGVHIVTVNEFLSTRDSEWMGSIFRFLGLSVGLNLRELSFKEKQDAYNCDILYSTNNELGFDYLRDNMVTSMEDKVLVKGLNYALIDEVDSILIDESRTPLIISGGKKNTAALYLQADRFVKSLIAEKDYEVDIETKTVSLTPKGIEKAEKGFKIDNLYDIQHTSLVHHINQALKANYAMTRDVEYMIATEDGTRDIRNAKIMIIDQFTGRVMPGRAYSDGLHQAIEAKEGVPIKEETETRATITYQNFFRLFNKLAGMTGTAKTEEEEFMMIYNMRVIEIPTNKPVIRDDRNDKIYSTKTNKFKALCDEVVARHAYGQPILIGTVSVETSEILSKMLDKRGIKHNTLNAKNHAKEAEIVAQAGRYGAVTIATNMAGRGTDIMLGGNPEFLAIEEVGSRDAENYNEVLEKYKVQCEAEREKVMALGGLFILGTERHESRRIDNQLRGRAGRQGDPGASEFYLSLEDDLMRLFGSDRVKTVMEKLGLPEGEPITHSMINKAIANAQTKIESRNFGIRKNLLEFDDVMNKQRTAIYASRNEAMLKDDLKETILHMLRDTIHKAVVERFVGEYKEDWDIQGLADFLHERYGYHIEDLNEYKSTSIENYSEKLYNEIVKEYEEKENRIGSDMMRRLEKYILFEVVDSRWREHLKSLDGLREGIYLRAYGQRDPIVEYKLLSGELYEKMLETIKEQTTSFLFKVIVRSPEEEMAPREEVTRVEDNSAEVEAGADGEIKGDDPCPCGSGKKYKNCCGRL